MKPFYYFFFLISISYNSIAQTTVVLEPAKDNTLFSENGNNSNALGVSLYAGTTANGHRRRSLLQFDLASIPQGSTITNVSLALTVNRLAPNSGNAGINLHKLTSDWGEATSTNNAQGMGSPASTNDATWTHRFFNTTSWTTPGGDFLASSGGVAISALGTVLISTPALVTDVQSWLSNPATNFGWAMVGNTEGTSASARGFASRNNATTSARPKLSITYTGALPVSLKSFTARINQQNIVLDWKTSSEVNSDHFNVEHSTNGQLFTTLAKQKAAGNSVTEQAYQFLHKGATKGKNFYRLAQYDKDGSMKYSPVVYVTKTSGMSIKVLPNPAYDFLTLSGNIAARPIQYVIRSKGGQVLLKGIYQNPINIKALPAGTYAITVLQADMLNETTLIIKR